jgi:single-strand DNA-binding protein
MSGNLDRTEIIGNVGKDPEMRYTEGGTAVSSFSVAVNRTWKSASGEQHEQTVWYRVACWGKLADIVKKFVAKGMKIYIDGQLIADKSTGGPRVFQRNDGTNGASFEIRADKVIFLGGGNQREAAPEAEEEIPF